MRLRPIALKTLLALTPHGRSVAYSGRAIHPGDGRVGAALSECRQVAAPLPSAALVAQTGDKASSQIGDLQQAQHGFKV